MGLKSSLSLTVATSHKKQNKATLGNPLPAPSRNRRVATSNLNLNSGFPSPVPPLYGNSMSTTKTFQLLFWSAAVIALSGCEAVWVVPVGVIAMAQSGDRDVSHNKKYWQGIDRNSTYELQRTVKFSPVAEESPYEAILHTISSDSARGDIHLPKGTLLKPIRVHYKSDGLNYTFIDYVGVLQSGIHKGKSVRMNNILLPGSEDNTMSVNQRYLRLSQ